jgi:hypothetical protein
MSYKQEKNKREGGREREREREERGVMFQRKMQQTNQA